MASPVPIADRDYGLIRFAAAEPSARAGAILQDEYDLDGPWHHHDMHQLQYAFEGSMELEDASGRHRLPRSLAGWIPAGTRHRNSLHRIRSLSVLLAPSSVADPGTGIRIVRVPPLMRAMIGEAARWPLGHRPGGHRDLRHDMVRDAFFTAFAALCGEWIADPASLTLPSTNDRVLDIALAQARADPAGSRMDQAARAAGLSERTLSRRCRAQLGLGWDEYRRRCRLLAGVEALTETDASIARIAADVGFDSQSAFARAFHRLTGSTPQAFRRQART